MPDKSPLVQARIDDAIEVLQLLGLPKAQWNNRTTMVLMALLHLVPTENWTESTNDLYGVLSIMAFIEAHYETKYAPNSRETIRRQSLHQMIDAGMVLQNPDVPNRPTNSAKNVYQIAPLTLQTLRTRGTASWSLSLEAYLKEIPTLRERYGKLVRCKRSL